MMNGRGLLLVVGAIVAFGLADAASAQTDMGTAFTYQGRLEEALSPANGQYDFEFKLCDDPVAACTLATTTVEDEQVDDGLFTVEIDFGADVFNGQARWLELGVRPGASADPYTTLSPRQELTPTPHALALPGLYTQQNAASPNLIGGYHGNWVTDGVVGATISGGGQSSRENRVIDDFGTVGGGWDNRAEGFGATVGGGYNNGAFGRYATVGGGWFNQAEADYATVAGGGPTDLHDPQLTFNRVYDDYGTIGGGGGNTAGDPLPDPTTGKYATVAGGRFNAAEGQYSMIPGGDLNWAAGAYSFAAGRRARADHLGTFVWADSDNNSFASASDNTFLIRASGGVGIGKNNPAEQLDVEGNIHASGTITSGSSITIDGIDDEIECPTTMDFLVDGDRALRLEPANLAPNVIGGIDNSAGAGIYGASIGGGGPMWPQGTFRCDAGNPYSCGRCNGGPDHGNGCNTSQTCREGGICEPDDTRCDYPGVCVWEDQLVCYGGPDHLGNCGVCVLGGNDGNECWWDFNCPDGTCEPDAAACGAPGICVSGSSGNTVTDPFGTIGGGAGNMAGDFDPSYDNAMFATVGGGRTNVALGQGSTIAGGHGNSIARWGMYAAIGGGYDNYAEGGEGGSTIAGGWGNTASAGCSIGGGMYNSATSYGGTVGGGSNNSASGMYAMIPGGTNNQAGGYYSFAGGLSAKVRTAADVGADDWDGDEGTFAWADANWNDFTSTGPNRFLVRASGGTWFYSNSTLTMGSYLAAGAGAWASVSDRDLKENVSSVDGREVLRKLDGIPVTTWNYKTEDAAIRHMGPTAQDLYMAFGLGDSEKSIGTIDADGVALAAIQGLYEVVKEKDAQIAKLAARLAALEKLMKQADAGQEGGGR